MSLAFIPSPGTGTLDLGPLTIHMYGLTLLVAIAACILLTGYRWTRRGGDWDQLLDNMEFLAELRRSGEIGRLSLYFVVQHANFREMPAMVACTSAPAT